MKKKRRVQFREPPKVLRKVRVSFTDDGKRVSFTKVQKVPKPIGKKYFVKRKPRLQTSNKSGEKDE